MKTNIFNKVKGLVKTSPFYLFTLLPLFTACSPDSFDGADETQTPSVNGINISVDVDQATNTLVATAPDAAMGTYHVWNLPPTANSWSDTDKADIWSTLKSVRRVFVQAGDKKVIYRVGNRNGFSQSVVEQTIHIDNSLRDLEGLAKILASTEGTMWGVGFEIENHLGYGAANGDGSSIWTAGEGKVDGLVCYDDRVVFYSGASEGNFKYNGTADYTAGADGKLQVGGFGATDNRNQDDVEGASYAIQTEGDNVYLKLSNMPLPFVPSESFLQNSVWRIDYYAKNEIDLVAQDGANSYRMVLVPAKAGNELGFTGFSAGENLLAGWQPELSFWFADNGWSQIADPAHSGSLMSEDGFAFTMNATGSSQWQAQVHFNKGENSPLLSADKTYDFSIVIESSADNVMVTMKPQMDGNDDVYLTASQYPLHKGINVIALSDVAGFDGNFKMATDFAGAPEGTEFVIRNVFLAEHNDANVVPFDYNAANNAWKAVDAAQSFNMSFWWADNGWTQIANPDFSVEDKSNGAKIYTIVASDGVGGSEWQAQNAFNTTDLSVSGTDFVDFSCVAICNQDTRATIKLCQTDDDDNTLIYKNDIQLKAGVAQVLKFTDTQLAKGTDAPAVKLIFDLGGIPAGAEFRVTDITLIKK